jgi:hypothetical protein
MKQETTNIHVGYAACPTCGEVCTAHKLATGHVSYDDWLKATLNYYCGKCQTPFQKNGDTDRWLSKEFRSPSQPI